MKVFKTILIQGRDWLAIRRKVDALVIKHHYRVVDSEHVSERHSIVLIRKFSVPDASKIGKTKSKGK